MWNCNSFGYIKIKKPSKEEGFEMNFILKKRIILMLLERLLSEQLVLLVENN
jgi:hypothetical protein